VSKVSPAALIEVSELKNVKICFNLQTRAQSCKAALSNLVAIRHLGRQPQFYYVHILGCFKIEMIRLHLRFLTFRLIKHFLLPKLDCFMCLMGKKINVTTLVFTLDPIVIKQG